MAATLSQPKKPMTAFFLYQEANRAAVLKEFAGEEKGKQYKLAVKTLAERWRSLPQAKKQPFETQAHTAKAAYDKEMEAFKAAGGVVERKAKRGTKPKKDKDAPKKPAGGGYGVYLNEHRAEIVKGLPAGASVITEVAKVAGARWKGLSAAAKAPYEAKFQAKMKEYTAALEQYKASKGDAEDEEDDGEEEGEEEAEEEAEQPPAKKTRGGKLGGTAASKKVAKSRVAALGA